MMKSSSSSAGGPPHELIRATIYMIRLQATGLIN